MDELWPPKPKELDSAIFTSSFWLCFPTMTSMSTSSSGSFRFMLGCTSPAIDLLQDFAVLPWFKNDILLSIWGGGNLRRRKPKGYYDTILQPCSGVIACWAFHESWGHLEWQTCLDSFHTHDCLNGSGTPKKVASHTFGGIHSHMLPREWLLDSSVLSQVPSRRGGCMRIDVIHRIYFNACLV